MTNKRYTFSQNGSAGIAAFCILIFIAFFTIAVTGHMFAVAKYKNAIKNKYKSIQEANTKLQSIVSDFQSMGKEDVDWAGCSTLQRLLTNYSDYGLTVTDVSSGINVNFFPDSEFKRSDVEKLLFPSANSSSFLLYRSSHDTSSDFSGMQNYFTTTGLTLISSYGWIHTDMTDSPAYKRIVTGFSAASSEKLFPLVNMVPLMNIYYMNNVLRELYVSRKSFGIKNYEQKLKILDEALVTSKPDMNGIAEILGISKTNAFFNYVGVKTTFWKLSFTTDACKITGYIAAIPKTKTSIKISLYKLIDRTITYEPTF